MDESAENQADQSNKLENPVVPDQAESSPSKVKEKEVSQPVDDQAQKSMEQKSLQKQDAKADQSKTSMSKNNVSKSKIDGSCEKSQGPPYQIDDETVSFNLPYM